MSGSVDRHGLHLDVLEEPRDSDGDASRRRETFPVNSTSLVQLTQDAADRRPFLTI